MFDRRNRRDKTGGNESRTQLQVSLNGFLAVFAYALIVAVLLGVTNIVVPWDAPLLSVVIFVALPLLAGKGQRAAVKPCGL